MAGRTKLLQLKQCYQAGMYGQQFAGSRSRSPAVQFTDSLRLVDCRGRRESYVSEDYEPASKKIKDVMPPVMQLAREKRREGGGEH
jgi:hypothetical protein